MCNSGLKSIVKNKCCKNDRFSCGGEKFHLLLGRWGEGVEWWRLASFHSLRRDARYWRTTSTRLISNRRPSIIQESAVPTPSTLSRDILKKRSLTADPTNGFKTLQSFEMRPVGLAPIFSELLGLLATLPRRSRSATSISLIRGFLIILYTINMSQTSII